MPEFLTEAELAPVDVDVHEDDVYSKKSKLQTDEVYSQLLVELQYAHATRLADPQAPDDVWNKRTLDYFSELIQLHWSRATLNLWLALVGKPRLLGRTAVQTWVDANMTPGPADSISMPVSMEHLTSLAIRSEAIHSGGPGADPGAALVEPRYLGGRAAAPAPAQQPRVPGMPAPPWQTGAPWTVARWTRSTISEM